MVSAEAARKHLQMLSDAGIGRDSVAAACDVSQRTVRKIRIGQRKQIRRSTELRILAVTAEAYGAGNHIDARPTWKQLDTLLEEGFTRAELARRLGLKKPELRFSKRLVEGLTAVRVDRFYRQIMAGADDMRAA